MTSRITQEQVNDLYTIMHLLDKAATNAGLQWVMAAGTALGAVRHGGLIPWDDDADVYVLEPHWNEVAYVFFHVAQQYGLEIRPHNRMDEDSNTWFKVYLRGKTFPNCDIFLLRYFDESFCYRPSDPYARKWWPKEFLLEKEIRSIRRVPFGPLMLPLFNSPEQYLTRSYGPNWRVVAEDNWDHVNDKQMEKNTRPIRDYRPALPTIPFL